MSPTWTEQQRAAIETHNVSIALSAGAGCGKTFVLTQRFLAELERGAGRHGLSGLVAITFTDKAAQEMRERIRAACQARLQQCSDEELPRWLQIVREIDTARVSTIHSFCTSILRSSAVSLGLDPQFGVLDDGVSQVLLRQAVEETVHRLLEEGHAAARALVLEYGLEGTQRQIEQLVPQRFQTSPSDWLEMTEPELAERWRSRFLKDARPALLKQFGQAEFVQHLITVLSANLPQNSVMQARRAVLLSELPLLLTPERIADPETYLEQLLENAKVQGGGTAKVWSSPEIYEAIKDGLSELRDAAKKLQAQVGFQESDLEYSARVSLQALQVTAAALEQYRQLKQDASVVDFDDLLLMAGEVLESDPDVCRRMAAGIDFLMVDEFQDTDPIQARLVRALCGVGLTTGKLFLVGDAQQSIYRFRRADPEVFRLLRLEIPPAGRLPLNRNFRSQPAILNFANSLFSGTLGESFQELVPQAAQLSPEPAIEFVWSEDAMSDAANFTAAARRQREAEWLARRLRELLADATPRIRQKNVVTGEVSLRPVRAGDIVILLRSMSDVRYYEAALRDCQLEYYLVGGRAFYAQQEIYDLLNLLQFLLDPDDQVSLMGALRSPLFGLNDDTLLAITHAGKTLREGLSLPIDRACPETQRDLARRADEILHELAQVKDRLPLSGLLQRILDLTGYDAALLTEFLGRRKLANLRKLIDHAREFDRLGRMTLADFVSQLGTAVQEETDEELAATQAEASDVIRIMTIHKSKGLEFPVVVVADLNRKPPAARAGTVLHPELGPMIRPASRFGYHPEHLGLRVYRLLEEEAEEAEKLRLLYVAVTRAADHLILSAGLAGLEKLDSTWMQLLAQRYDLRTGHPQLNPDGTPAIPAPYCERVPQIQVHLVSPRSPVLVPTERQRLNLEQFRESVAQATPGPLPELLAPLPVDSSRPQIQSVSFLESQEARLFPQPGVPIHSALHINSQLPEEDFDRTELGTLIHAALEMIDWQGDVTQIPGLLLAGWSATLRPLPPELAEAATRQIEALWNSSWGTELRQARRLFREIDFLLPVTIERFAEPFRISGQIDCVFETAAGEWVICDYKTGRGAHSEPLWQVYDLQLGIYAWAWGDYIGQLPKRVEILQLTPEVAASSWPVTESHLQQIQQRVRQILQV